MIKRILYSTIALVTFSTIATANEKQTPEPDGTYLFTSRDTCDLYLDIYNPVAGSERFVNGKEKPTILFMFGGGFIRGTRDDAGYGKWFRMLTENGYGVISIAFSLFYCPSLLFLSPTATSQQLC